MTKKGPVGRVIGRRWLNMRSMSHRMRLRATVNGILGAVEGQKFVATPSVVKWVSGNAGRFAADEFFRKLLPETNAFAYLGIFAAVSVLTLIVVDSFMRYDVFITLLWTMAIAFWSMQAMRSMWFLTIGTIVT